MPRQLTIAREQPDTAAAVTNEQSDWLRTYLETERKNLHSALGELLAIERQKFERKTNEFELKIAKLNGAVDILRGAQPPSPTKFPTIKAWSDAIHYQGEVVTHNGSTYQAQRDTAHAPPSPEWTCLAAAGAGFRICGTYDVHKKYQKLDVVIVNGSSFAALNDNPGPCPGDDWRLLSGRGSRGGKGEIGERGPRGEKGENGAPGADALTITSWMLDRARYRAIPMMSNGKPGPELELRGLFEQFFSKTASSNKG